jgi:hypothetical protein
MVIAKGITLKMLPENKPAIPKNRSAKHSIGDEELGTLAWFFTFS